MNCSRPDHDNPKMICGYPIPCPYHTVTVEYNDSGTVIEVPITANVSQDTLERIAEIAKVFEP